MDPTAESLAAVNTLVTAAIETWPMAPRVKRLVTPSYHYRIDDGDHLVFIGAWHDVTLVGIAVLETTATSHLACPSEQLLHGLFVLPEMHGRGIGTQLIDASKSHARQNGAAALLVKAERHAVGFFQRQGFRLLDVTDPVSDYPFRLCLDL